MRRIRTLVLVAGLVVVVTARAGDGAGPQPGGDVFTAIVGTILAGPVPAVHGTDGRHHVVYELVLTNTEAVLYDSQRFAIDFVQADAEGRLVVGDAANVRSWVGYGAIVRAAAAGRVVASRNDLSDQIPGSLPDPHTITVDNVDGNFVVLDHGGGIYTFYAHFQPKSVKVVRGDRVEAGQELGRLGNTGNTSGPHLHFHVMAGPSPLGSNGVPFVFSAFDLATIVGEASLDSALSGAASLPARQLLKPTKRERQLPLDRTLIDF